jgi:hypothetical protein
MESIIDNSNCYENFGFTAKLLRLSNRTKIEQLSSITIAYIATIMGNKDPTHCKRMRILIDSGCAANLINQSFIETLDTTKKENKVEYKD